MITLKQLKEELKLTKEYIKTWPKWKKELYKRAESYYTLPEPNKISTDEMNKIVEEGREFSKEFDTMKKAIENLTEEDLHAKCGPTAIYNKEKTLIIGEHRSDDIIWRGIKLEYRGESDGYDQNYYYSSINDSIVDIDVVNTKSRYRNNVCLKFESTIYKTEIHNETIEGAFAKLDEELEEQAKQYAWLLRNFANG